MARARNIKPGFYKNEDLAECSIWARFIFPGLWMLADREGRLEDRPKRIKGELIPFDSQDVEPLLRELEARVFIRRYQNTDGRFIQILKFATHQSPHYSEKASVIKPPVLPEIEVTILHKVSEKPPPIKRGSQPPDSLNPDSPTPESLEPSAEADPWQAGKKFLTSRGMTDSNARSFIGMCVKKNGKQETVRAIQAAIEAESPEPESYIVAFLQNRPKPGKFDPVAYNARTA